MRFYEFAEKDAMILEFGRHEHPGYGRGIFTDTFYGYFAEGISEIKDAQIKEFVANWMAKIFKMDNSRFKNDQFMQAAMSDYYNSRRGMPKLQQRHFYYIAGAIKEISDEHARRFCAEFIGKMCKRANPQFQQSRWDKFCGVEAAPTKALPAPKTARGKTPALPAPMDDEPVQKLAPKTRRRDALDLD